MNKQNKPVIMGKFKYASYDYLLWIKYFQENTRRHERLINELKASENLMINEQIVFSSLQKFCLGEASDGNNYRQKVSEKNNEQLEQAIDLFIAEENRHSQFLEIILRANQQVLIKETFLDKCFRRLRKNVSMITSVNVLLTAEIIAISYYRVISEVTNNRMLAKVCKQMLFDETAHLVFQAYNNKQYSKNSFLKNIGRKILMAGAVTSLYISEGNVFRLNHTSYFKLLRQSNHLLNEVIKLEKMEQ